MTSQLTIDARALLEAEDELGIDLGLGRVLNGGGDEERIGGLDEEARNRVINAVTTYLWWMLDYEAEDARKTEVDDARLLAGLASVLDQAGVPWRSGR